MKRKLAVIIAVLAAMALFLAGCASEESAAVETSDPYAAEEQVVQSPEAAEDKISLSFTVEGVEETVPAYMYEGMDYTIVVPEGGWHMYEPGAWQSTFNQSVSFWIKGYSGETLDSLTSQLGSSGYVYTVGSRNMTRSGENGLVENVMVYQNGDSLKAVFYCYPEDVAEGFGVRLSTIVNTFAWKDPQENSSSGSQAGLSIGQDSSADAQSGSPADAAQSGPAAQIDAMIADAETKARVLEEKLMNDQTQADMNSTSAELYTLWDDTINAVWNVLKANMDEGAFDSLLNEQIAWIGEKEAAVQAAAAEYQGGSLAPLAANQRAAEMTRERVMELAEYLK